MRRGAITPAQPKVGGRGGGPDDGGPSGGAGGGRSGAADGRTGTVVPDGGRAGGPGGAATETVRPPSGSGLPGAAVRARSWSTSVTVPSPATWRVTAASGRMSSIRTSATGPGPTSEAPVARGRRCPVPGPPTTVRIQGGAGVDSGSFRSIREPSAMPASPRGTAGASGRSSMASSAPGLPPSRADRSATVGPSGSARNRSSAVRTASGPTTMALALAMVMPVVVTGLDREPRPERGWRSRAGLRDPGSTTAGPAQPAVPLRTWSMFWRLRST